MSLHPGGSNPSIYQDHILSLGEQLQKYGDEFFNSPIDNRNAHIPSPLCMLTNTSLRHGLRKRQRNQGVHLKCFKSKLNVDSPDLSNYFNYKNDEAKKAACCSTTGRKLLTMPGNADTYTYWMNTSNTLLESYQQRVYNNPLAIVQRQMQLVEKPTSTMVISLEAVRVDNTILLDYLTSEVALEDFEIESTVPTSGFTTISGITNCILGCQGAAEIAKMLVTKVKWEMPTLSTAGHKGL
jgi:hypothetical protein